MIDFRCDECGLVLGVPDEQAGGTYECPACGKAVVIPGQDAAPPGQADDAAAPRPGPVKPGRPKLGRVTATLAVVVALVVWRVISPAPLGEAEEHYGRGVDYASEGDFDHAIQEHTKAIELRPGFAKAFLRRGYAYSKQDDYDRAIVDFTKAIELEPDNAIAYYARGEAHRLKGAPGLARSDFQRAIALAPGEEAGRLARLALRCMEAR